MKTFTQSCTYQGVPWNMHGSARASSKKKGFALLCVAYPKSDLHVVIGEQVEDDLYNDQFGKYQK